MDIFEEISEDHHHIRNQLLALLTPGAEQDQKKIAFENLSALLETHTEAEEKTIYAFAKRLGALHHLAYQGVEEHETIDMMLDKIEAAKGSAIRQARMKVLSDLLRHHLDEEEEVLLPALRREISTEQSDRLAREYREVMPSPNPDELGYGRVIPYPGRRTAPQMDFHS